MGVKRSLYMYLYLSFLWFFFLLVFFGFPWHFRLVSWFWFHLVYIRKVHGFLQLLYMHSGNNEDRFLFCQCVSILIFCRLGFYYRFLFVVFHFKVFQLFLVLSFLIVFFLFWTEIVYLEEFLQLIPSQRKTGNNLVFLVSWSKLSPSLFLLAGVLFVLYI